MASSPTLQFMATSDALLQQQRSPSRKAGPSYDGCGCASLNADGQRKMKRMGVAARAAVVVTVGVLASCSSGGPPPLGASATVSSGLQCTPGKTLADGFYTLQNMSDETVTVTGVRLIGGSGQKITSPAYLMPIYHTALPGLDSWPLHWPTWKDRRRVPATIAPHTMTNLVFAQTRTSDHPKPVTAQVSYTAGGNNYTMTQSAQVLVAVKCD